MGDRNDASRLSRRGSMSERRGDPSLTSEQEVMNAVASASSIGDMGPPLRPAGSAPAPAGLHPYFTEEIPSAPPATPRIPLSPKFERSATAFGDLLKAGSVRSVPKSAILRSQREESVSDEETYDSDKTVTASNWKKKGKGKKKKRETVVESIERRGKVKDSGRGGSDDGAKALPVM